MGQGGGEPGLPTPCAVHSHGLQDETWARAHANRLLGLGPRNQKSETPKTPKTGPMVADVLRKIFGSTSGQCDHVNTPHMRFNEVGTDCGSECEGGGGRQVLRVLGGGPSAQASCSNMRQVLLTANSQWCGPSTMYTNGTCLCALAAS